MSNADLLPSLLFKINQNQLALEAAIMELTLWVEQHGSAEVADNVRGALDTISKNEEFINMTLAVLMTPEREAHQRIDQQGPSARRIELLVDATSYRSLTMGTPISTRPCETMAGSHYQTTTRSRQLIPSSVPIAG